MLVAGTIFLGSITGCDEDIPGPPELGPVPDGAPTPLPPGTGDPDGSMGDGFMPSDGAVEPDGSAPRDGSVEPDGSAPRDGATGDLSTDAPSSDFGFSDGGSSTDANGIGDAR